MQESLDSDPLKPSKRSTRAQSSIEKGETPTNKPNYDLSILSFPFEDEYDFKSHKKRKYSKQKSTEPRAKAVHPKEKPRWWNQSYLMYLALRQAERPLSRKDLLPKVVELDKKMAEQRGLPYLFHGKASFIFFSIYTLVLFVQYENFYFFFS
jgi:hypothetical protein